jgi:fatty-acyl-CoA synthase
VNVYGVKVGDLDGKAGMASLVTVDDFDMAAFGKYVDEQLPSYARPLFVRLQQAIETTGTFKYRKMDLVNDGFDPAKTKDPLYFRDPAKGYVKITKAFTPRSKAVSSSSRLDELYVAKWGGFRRRIRHDRRRQSHPR